LTGKIYEERREKVLAQKFFKKAFEECEKSPLANYHLGQSHMNKGLEHIRMSSGLTREDIKRQQAD